MEHRKSCWNWAKDKQALPLTSNHLVGLGHWVGGPDWGEGRLTPSLTRPQSFVHPPGTMEGVVEVQSQQVVPERDLFYCTHLPLHQPYLIWVYFDPMISLLSSDNFLVVGFLGERSST